MDRSWRCGQLPDLCGCSLRPPLSPRRFLAHFITERDSDGSVMAPGLTPIAIHRCCGLCKMPNDGLEREFKFFNQLDGCVCTMCAPGDQGKSRDNRCEHAEPSASASGVDGRVERARPVWQAGLHEPWQLGQTPANSHVRFA